MKLAIALLLAAGCSYESSLGGRNAPLGVDGPGGLTTDAADHDASPFDAPHFAWEGATTIGTTPFVGGTAVEHGNKLYGYTGNTLYSIDKSTAAYAVVATDAPGATPNASLTSDASGLAYVMASGHVAVRPWSGASVELSTVGVTYGWAAVAGDYVFAMDKARLDRFPRAGGAATTIAVAPSPACMIFGPITTDATDVYFSGLYGDASDGCPVEVGPRNWFFQRVPQSATGVTAPVWVPFDSETLLATGGDRVYGTRQIPVYAPKDGSGRTHEVTGVTWPTQSNAFEMVAHGDVIYWTAWQEPPGVDGMAEIGCAPVDGSAGTILSRGPGEAFSIAVDDDNVYWRTGCGTNLQGCPEMTLRKAPACH